MPDNESFFQGNNGGGSSRTLTAFDENLINRGTLNSPRPLLKFHTVHGSNISLSDNRLLAKRRENVFCKGLVFSDRPVEVDEVVCIKLTQVCNSWSGNLRFGVTNVDPASFRDIELPKFACPDLTAKTGYWAKAVTDRFTIQGSILHFYLTSMGTMYIGCNGTTKGIYMLDIDVSKPLWIIMDVYGKSVAVEFLSEINERTRAEAARSEQIRVSSISNNLLSTTTTPTSVLPESPISSTTSPSPRRQSSDSPPTRPPRVPPISISQPQMPLPYRFHHLVGVNAVQVSGWEVARKDNQYDRGYCFLSRPIIIDEVISLTVTEIETAFHGSLAFGLTNCNPNILKPAQLPADSDDLLERPEYWVVIKDVAVLPNCGDVLSFSLKSDGRVLFAKNNGFPRTILHMDVSVPLWPFFDIFGRTKKIRLSRPRRLNTLSQDSSSESSREPSTEPPARPPPPNFSVNANSSNNSLPLLDSPAIERFNSAPIAHAGQNRISSLSDTTRTSEPLLRGLSPRLQPDFIVGSSTSVNTSNSDNIFTPNVPSNASSPVSLTARTPEPQRRESDSVSSAFNLTPASPNTPSSTTNNIFPTSFQRSEETSPAPDTSITASNRLNNAERTIWRNIASLYLTPTVAGSAPQFSTSRSTPTLPPPITPAQQSSISVPSTTKHDQSPDVETCPNECVICFSASANAAVYRCGHVCMCLTCARKLMSDQGKCPMCRQGITDVVQLFFS